MKLTQIVFLSIIISVCAISCHKDDYDPDKIEVSGTIQKQGITTYQYGTHIIAGYAIRSSSIILDDYINKEVTIIGYKIDGYPVDGGPDYIEVEEIK